MTPLDLRNANEIFRKNVAYDNIKSHKKPGFPLSLENTFLEKPQGGGVKLTPPPPVFLGLRKNFCSSVRIERNPCYLVCINTRFDRLPSPKCECNNGMHPIAKFLFKMIYNGNISQYFSTLVQPDRRLCFCFMLEVFTEFWKFIQLKHLVEINYRGLAIK